MRDSAAAGRVAPASIDEEARGPVLRTLLLTFVALTFLIAILGLVTGAYEKAVLSGVGGIVYAGLLLLQPHIGTRASSYATTTWYFLLATGAMAHGRGILDVSVVLLPAGILMGTLLLGRSHLVVLSVIATAIAVVIGIVNVVDPPEALLPPTMADVTVVALLLVVAVIVTVLTVRTLQAAMTRRMAAEDELQKRNVALQMLGELADRLHRTHDARAIAGDVVDVLTGHGEAPLVALYLLDDAKTSLHLFAHHGFGVVAPPVGETLSLDASLSGLAIREGRVVVASNIASDPRANPAVREMLASRGMKTAIAVPLAYEGEALGTMNLIFSSAEPPSPLETETFEGIGRAVSLALANARHVADLEHRAFHDGLTSLPNRAGLHRRFAEHAAAANGGRIGLVLADLDRFREINGALGHGFGDELLLRIAARLAEGKEGERSEVFRLGGDEFAVLLLGVEDKAGAEARAARVHSALGKPCEIGGIAIEPGGSIGVAVWPDDGRDSAELLRHAEVAMYRAKQTAAGVVSYGPELDRHTPDRLALIADLARTIREGGLVLHYQPTVSLLTGTIVGFEALVRWPHPRLGLLPPKAFLPLAEATEVINGLTYWVVGEALAQLRRWMEIRPDLTMAMNLSPRNLLDHHCAERLREALHDARVAPDHVEFELTETAVIDDPDSALTVLQQITAAGARLSIDDFGTGYSSLAYLKRFPLHGIKIDRSFVTDIASEPNAAIVGSTVKLAQRLGLSVVAEGIEDQQTALALRDIGCELAQGYYFAAPAPAGDLDRIVAAGSKLWPGPTAS